MSLLVQQPPGRSVDGWGPHCETIIWLFESQKVQIVYWDEL
ncbi:MAG: hypothetical protein P8N02_02985 [Actinomycetota bacterium]|nr:hypothetical protein [Actinomycetota bacterium]